MTDQDQPLISQLRVGIFQFSVTLYNTLKETKPPQEALDETTSFLRDLADTLDKDNSIS